MLGWDVLKELTGMYLHRLNETAMNRSEWKQLVKRIASSRQQLDGSNTHTNTSHTLPPTCMPPHMLFEFLPR